MFDYLEAFNYVQTIVFVCKQINSDSFKDKITYKLLTYKSCVWPLNCMQSNELWLIQKCYLQTMCL